MLQGNYRAMTVMGAMAVLMACSGALAAPVATDIKGAVLTPAEKIRETLQQRVSIDLKDATFDEFIDYIRNRNDGGSKLNVVVDRSVQPFLRGHKISVKLKDVKLSSALTAVIGQYNLTYVIVGDVLVVTTRQQAVQRQLRQQVNVDLKNVPLKKALEQLARETATNIVIDSRLAKEADKAITVNLNDVSLVTAVRIIAELAGLKSALVENVLLVTTEERAMRLAGDPTFPGGGFPGIPPEEGGPIPEAPPPPDPNVPPVEPPAPPPPPPAVPIPPRDRD
ncbi:MAG: hypothetical protein KatS3mg105_1919 [Gemmatales bacterium]|nr:MAG: hypothetical protein KatS3mg105_1919 [Gemmatales bacterium]